MPEQQASKISLLHARLEAAQLKLRQEQGFYVSNPTLTGQVTLTHRNAEIRQLARQLAKEYAK